MFVTGCTSFADFDALTHSASRVTQQLVNAANGYADAVGLKGGLPPYWWRDAAGFLQQNKLRNDEEHPPFLDSAQFVLDAFKQQTGVLPDSCVPLLVAAAKYANKNAQALEDERKARRKAQHAAAERFKSYV